VDDHGAGSECSVLIYYSHNLHSLFSYSVDLVLVDHGHMRLGYELSTRSNVLTTVSSTRYMYHKSGAEFAVTALSWSFLYNLQESLLLENLLLVVIIE